MKQKMCDRFEIYLILLHAVFSEDFTTVQWGQPSSVQANKALNNRLYLKSKLVFGLKSEQDIQSKY